MTSPNFDQVGFAAEMAEAHHMTHLLVSGGSHGSPGCSIDSLIAQHSSESPQEEWNHCDVAALQLSGGSTGVPKVIPRYHGEYLAHTKAWCDLFGCEDGDVGIWALPMLHNAGMMFSLLRSVLHHEYGRLPPVPRTSSPTPRGRSMRPRLCCDCRWGRATPSPST